MEGNNIDLAGNMNIDGSVVGGNMSTRAGVINNLVLPTSDEMRRPGEWESSDKKIDFMLDVLLGNGVTTEGLSGHIKKLEGDVVEIRRQFRLIWIMIIVMFATQLYMMSVLWESKRSIESIEAASTPSAIMPPGPQ